MSDGSATLSSNIDYELLVALLEKSNTKNVHHQIVTAPFTNKVDMVFLFMGFLCLYIADERTQEVHLVAASGTDEYHRAVENMNFKTSRYTLNFDKHSDNTIVQAILHDQPRATIDWATLSSGHTSIEGVRLNQANSGIAYSAIYPLQEKKGALMYNYYQYPEAIGHEQQAFMKRYTALASRYLSK